MSQLDILLPFGLPHAEMAADLLRACKTPALAMLLARAKPVHTELFDAFARSLPHETWLARRFGLEDGLLDGGSPPIATAAMQHFGLKPESGFWFALDPVHIHIARDHLVLTDVRRLTLTGQESRALFDTARPLFEEFGNALLYGDAHTWFVEAAAWRDLQTSTPDAACGHNIDIWMPKNGAGDTNTADDSGGAERAWRKLQNEVQMHWHTHAVNAERAACGMTPVNSVWLWGGAAAAMKSVPTDRPAYEEVFNMPGWMKAFGQFTGMQTQGFTAHDILETAPCRGLLALDALISPALANDWSAWLQQLHRLEEEWFAPMLAALKNNQIDRVSLLFSHNTALSEFAVTRQSLRRFWSKPSLKALLP